MTLNNFPNNNQYEFSTCNDNCTSFSNDLKKLTKSNPILTTGIISCCTLGTASIISPTIRKITVPACKFVVKKQLKLLAGIGILSIATYLSNQSSNIDDSDM